MLRGRVVPEHSYTLLMTDTHSTKYQLDSVIQSRASVRAFTQRPVSDATVEDILRVAARAPSGVNTQPWRAYVLRGECKEALVRKVCKVHDGIYRQEVDPSEFKEEYPYYPHQWFSPYLDRRRQNGLALYELVGISKGDKDRMHHQHQNNFRFFGAPVGIMFTVHRELEQGSLIDYGMFLQNVMLAARARELDTCPQAAWNAYARIILPHVGASENEMLVCGMSLGYRDESAAVNRLQTPREETRSFVKFV